MAQFGSSHTIEDQEEFKNCNVQRVTGIMKAVSSVNTSSARWTAAGKYGGIVEAAESSWFVASMQACCEYSVSHKPNV